MAGTIFWHGAIQVFIAAEDHPPPHIHAHHASEGWTARFRFSFLSDITGLYRFRRRQRRPGVATLNAVADAIMDHLPACREAWWNTHGSRHGIGLVNQRVEFRPTPDGDGVRARVARKADPHAASITTAAYDVRTGRVTLSLANGRTLSLTAGQHIEEAAEW
jgi:hypothetical protein|nr:hypothetical protein NG677_10915 [Methylobacterium sp. OTU13CASTA1]